MDNVGQMIEVRLRTIIRNRFDQATHEFMRAYAEARSKNPHSGTWIIESNKAFYLIIQEAIKDCVQKMDAEISLVFRENPQTFWDKARQYLKERVFPSISSYQATLLNQNPNTPGHAIQKALSQISITLSHVVDREVGECIQRDHLKKIENDIAKSRNSHSYVAQERLNDLKSLKSHDPQKLIRLCEEINSAFSANNYSSTIMLLRAILDHVPPVFSKANFSEVANQHAGGKSFKDLMIRLDASSRKIADTHLHSQIREKESSPNSNQVNFSAELDCLLAEIIRIGC